MLYLARIFGLTAQVAGREGWGILGMEFGRFGWVVEGAAVQHYGMIHRYGAARGQGHN